MFQMKIISLQSHNDYSGIQNHVTLMISYFATCISECRHTMAGLPTEATRTSTRSSHQIPRCHSTNKG